MGIFENLFNKQAENPKFVRLRNLLHTLSLNKVQEITAKLKSGRLGKEEGERAMIFQSLPISQTDLESLNQHKYESIEKRLEMLNRNNYYDESVMIGILFLTDENDQTSVYDKALKIGNRSFLAVLYQTCIALHHQRIFSLCEPYIDLLEKLLIAYPEHAAYFSKDIIEKISFDCFRNSE